MARLDRLSAIKEVAQIGAAIGREFTYRLLAAVAPISGNALQSALEQLTRAGLIFGRGEPPDSTYIFKHALLQDAAYASLLRGRRQQLHRRIADALESQFAELAETQPQLMAHHLAQAGLTELAINYLRKAGQRANESSANVEAIGHLKLALELLQSLPDGPGHRRKALELHVMLAQAKIAGRGYAAPETREVLLRAKALTDKDTEVPQKCSILYGIWASYYVAGEVAMQQKAALEFLAEAERHGETGSICLSHRTLGTTYVQMGEFSAGRRHLERARELYDELFVLGAVASRICRSGGSGGGRGEDTRRGVVTSVYARLHHLSCPRHDGYLPSLPAGCAILCQRRHFDLHRARLSVLGGGRADSRRLGRRVPGEGRRGD